MQKEQEDLLVIIPAYNEESNIGRVLQQLKAEGIFDIADVLVMNDASQDHTEEIIRNSDCQCITHVFNLGYGSGLKVGYKYAMERGYQYVIQLDADGQHDVCNIGQLYHSLRQPRADGCCPDIVLGSRFLPGSQSFHISPLKQIAMEFFRKLIWWTAHQQILDPTTGLQGLNRNAMEYYAGYLHFDDRYPDANMILQMLLLGFRVEEIPAVMHERTSGTSMHAGLEPVFYMVRMVFSVFAVVFRCKILKIDQGIGNQTDKQEMAPV